MNSPAGTKTMTIPSWDETCVLLIPGVGLAAASGSTRAVGLTSSVSVGEYCEKAVEAACDVAGGAAWVATEQPVARPATNIAKTKQWIEWRTASILSA